MNLSNLSITKSDFEKTFIKVVWVQKRIMARLQNKEYKVQCGNIESKCFLCWWIWNKIKSTVKKSSSIDWVLQSLCLTKIRLSRKDWSRKQFGFWLKGVIMINLNYSPCHYWYQCYQCHYCVPFPCLALQADVSECHG